MHKRSEKSIQSFLHSFIIVFLQAALVQQMKEKDKLIADLRVRHLFITYDEQHNKGHIYRTISHVCHNKIVRPLGNFVACDWLS